MPPLPLTVRGRGRGRGRGRPRLGSGPFAAAPGLFRAAAAALVVAALLLPSLSLAQPSWPSDSPSASNGSSFDGERMTDSGEAPLDPRAVAAQALDRLESGEGWFHEDSSDDESSSSGDWWDLGEDGPSGPGLAGRDLGEDVREEDLGDARALDGAEEAIAAEAEDAPADGPSEASLPTGEDRSAVKPQLISTPSGEGKIEGMGESFAPQLNTGTASFSIPIALPPGRGGTQPGLSLGYSSGGSNGPLGIGWDLPYPFIARQIDKGMPTYRDPSAGFAQDRFKYNGGQELVQITEPLPDETFQVGGTLCTTIPAGWLYFRARVEGAFLRFFMSTDGRQWRVQDKDGTWWSAASLGSCRRLPDGNAPLDGARHVEIRVRPAARDRPPEGPTSASSTTTPTSPRHAPKRPSCRSPSQTERPPEMSSTAGTSPR